MEAIYIISYAALIGFGLRLGWEGHKSVIDALALVTSLLSFRFRSVRGKHLFEGQRHGAD